MQPTHPFLVFVSDSEGKDCLNWYETEKEANDSAKMACEEGEATIVYVLKVISYANPFYDTLL
jgi:hypothetical protein